MAEKKTVLLISDFTVDLLKGFLNAPGDPALNAECAPFGQVMPLLMNPRDPVWQDQRDVVIVWTRPQAVIPLFRKALNFEQVNLDELLAEVDAFCEPLKTLKDRANLVLVPQWQIPAWFRGMGVFDLKAKRGIRDILTRMNLRLSDNLAATAGFHVLDPENWTIDLGREAFSPKLWYLSKVPYDTRVFKAAADYFRLAVRAVFEPSRKLIILDLDETLWGGILGEVGWEHIQLGGHDPIGEAHVDFQQALKALTNRGIILAIASKNDEQTALEAIEKHPEMVLRKNLFSAWRINWEDKAQNIVSLVRELNLGLSSAVFIDDNPAERARVKEALPEVLVPDWPENKLLYKPALQSLTCFDAPSVSFEDSRRVTMYAEEKQRQESLTRMGDLDEWLRTLNVRLEIEELTEANLDRTVQLLNKTNQMNLSTRRLSESELLNWLGQGERKLWTFGVSDRFGDSGLTGIVSVEKDGDTVRIVDFILSCRVFGREIEHAMLHEAVCYARQNGARQVLARYLPTAKNKPCFDFLHHSGMTLADEENTFVWNTAQEYPFPGTLRQEIIASN